MSDAQIKQSVSLYFAGMAKALIADPLDLIPTEDLLSTNFSQEPKNAQGLSLHIAADDLHEGRYSLSTGSAARIAEYLGTHCGSTFWHAAGVTHQMRSRRWQLMSSIAFYAYWHLFGRDHALGQFILHPEHTPTTSQWEFDFASQDGEPTASDDGVCVVRYGRLSTWLVVPDDTQATFRPVRQFWKNVDIAANTLAPKHAGAAVDWHTINEAGRSVAEAMKLEENCLWTTIRNMTAAAAAQVRSSEAINRTFLLPLFKALGIDANRGRHHYDDEMTALCQRLLLLSVYVPVAGTKCAIKLLPTKDNRGARACLFLWGDGSLQSYAARLSHSTLDCIQSRDAGRIALNCDSTKLANLIPDVITRTEDGAEQRVTDEFIQKAHGTFFFGLEQYLRTALKLAEVSVHEKESLAYTFLVARGLFVSKHVEKISMLVDSEPIMVFPENLPRKADDTGINRLVSLIQGNYSFFQGDDRFILCTTDGECLFLGRTVSGKSVEAMLSSEPSRANAKEDQFNEFYAIRVRRGSVQVFSAEGLVLWWNSGRWTVPDHYGARYKSSFLAAIMLKLTHVRDDMAKAVEEHAQVLFDIVWSLVTEKHKGGGFAFGDTRRALSESTYPMTSVLPFAENKRLATRELKGIITDLAIQDGVTFVDMDSGCVSGRRLLAAGLPRDRDLSKLESPKEWPWGARRHSAKLLSMAHPELVTIAVSTDGTVDVFHNGDRVHDACYPDKIT